MPPFRITKQKKDISAGAAAGTENEFGEREKSKTLNMAELLSGLKRNKKIHHEGT